MCNWTTVHKVQYFENRTPVGTEPIQNVIIPLNLAHRLEEDVQDQGWWGHFWDWIRAEKPKEAWATQILVTGYVAYCTITKLLKYNPDTNVKVWHVNSSFIWRYISFFIFVLTVYNICSGKSERSPQIKSRSVRLFILYVCKFIWIE